MMNKCTGEDTANMLESRKMIVAIAGRETFKRISVDEVVNA